MNDSDPLWQEWRDLNLPLPPVPADFAADLRSVGPLILSTRATLPYSLYALESYVAEAEAKRISYLAIGQAGHGVNSYAMHYYLVTDRLHLFVQTPYGGAYSNEERDLATLTRRFEQIGQLLAAAESSTRLTEAGVPLRVVESERAMSVWGLLDGIPTISRRALHEATTWLEGKGGS